MRKLSDWLRSIVSAIVCAIAIMGAANGLAGEIPASTFRAGAYAIDVTPQKFPVIVNAMFEERTADRAHDPLHARCLVLSDGATTVAIAVVDSAVMPRDLLDEAKRLANKATGIPTDRILISATHTHSAPSVMGALGSDPDPEYSRFLPGQIAKGIELAAKNLIAARAGWAITQAPEYTHCRRWILRPDKIRTDPFGQRTVRAMMHPGHQNPDFLGPSGPVDPDITILSVQSLEGRPIALLANFSMHYYGSPLLSADYYGRFAEKVKQMIGAENAEPPFVAIMSQGTSGDLMWMDYSQPSKPQNMDAYAETIARLSFEACKKIQYRDRARLAMREKRLVLGVRQPDAQRLAWAKKIVAEMGNRKPRTQPEIYAREQIFLSEQPTREVVLQALRIGDLGIAAISCEVFGITGLKIKAQSPLNPTFTIELASGCDGYLPPSEQHRLGGYTTWAARTACLEVGAEPKIADAVLALLEKVAGRPRRAVAEHDNRYAQAVVASKPIAYWRMNEFNGPSAADRTGRGNNGYYEDGVAFYLDGPVLPGLSPAANGLRPSNRAPHFAGGRMKAAIGDLGPTYSVEMWFCNFLPTDARAVTGYLFSRGEDGAKGAPGDHLGLGGQTGAAGRLLFFNGDVLSQTLAGRTQIPLKTWNHVVLVRDGKKVAVYLNGETTPEISGEAAAGFPSGVGQLYVGGRSDNLFNFEGKIDEVAVYDHALSASEVAKHYAATRDFN